MTSEAHSSQDPTEAALLSVPVGVAAFEIRCVVVGDTLSKKYGVLSLGGEFQGCDIQVGEYIGAIELQGFGLEASKKERKTNYPSCDVVVVCFSLLNKSSFEEAVSEWVPEVKSASKTPILLVGMEKDKRDAVAKDSESCIAREEAEQKATTLKVPYIECGLQREEQMNVILGRAAKMGLEFKYGPKKKKKKKRTAEPLPIKIVGPRTAEALLVATNPTAPESKLPIKKVSNLVKKRNNAQAGRSSFGKALEELPLAPGKQVPLFLQMLLSWLQKHWEAGGDQLFVVPKPPATKKLRKKLDRGGILKNETPDEFHPNVVMNALASFLLGLPEPVVPFDSYDTFLKATSAGTRAERASAIKSLLQGIPELHRGALCSILEFVNRMHQSPAGQSSVDLAAIFSPLLVRTEIENRKQREIDEPYIRMGLKLMIEESHYMEGETETLAETEQSDEMKLVKDHLKDSTVKLAADASAEMAETPAEHQTKAKKKRFMFGIPIEEAVEGAENGVLPLVKICIDLFEETDAINQTGILRLTGNAGHVNELKACFERNGTIHTKKPIKSHTVASLMKLYLRTLPEPITTFRYYTTYLKLAGNPDRKVRMKLLCKVVAGLPRPNRNTLWEILDFLEKIAENDEVNKMSTSNVAVVMAHNLFWPREANAHSMLVDTAPLVAVTKCMIQEKDFLFQKAEALRYKTDEEAGDKPANIKTEEVVQEEKLLDSSIAEKFAENIAGEQEGEGHGQGDEGDPPERPQRGKPAPFEALPSLRVPNSEEASWGAEPEAQAETTDPESQEEESWGDEEAHTRTKPEQVEDQSESTGGAPQAGEDGTEATPERPEDSNNKKKKNKKKLKRSKRESKRSDKKGRKEKDKA